MPLPGAEVQRELTASQQEWLRVRGHLREYRYELTVSAAGRYPEARKLAGTPLLTTPMWVLDAPMPLEAIDLEFREDAAFRGVTGSEDAARSVLPERPDGTRYPSYSAVIGELAAPAVFENRSTYRLVDANLSGRRGRLAFGRGTYFDSINTGEASAHEYAATRLNPAAPTGLREAVGDPCDLTKRPVNVAISTLTLRHDRASGEVTFFLHWRDPAKVGHAGGLYQVLPVGVFQASGEAEWNERNDFSLWRGMVREFAEELLGHAEDHGSERAPVNYDAWPFAARMTKALEVGDIRAYCLGLGVDPLTFATDLLTAVVINAPVFDELFGDLVATNDEGRILASFGTGDARGIAFTPETVGRFVHNEPMQAAGAALLALASQHRARLIA